MDYFKVSDEEKVKILATFGKTRDDVVLGVNFLEEWWRTQMELPLDFKNKCFLETVLLRSTFDVENAKIRIGNYFKYTKMYPEIFCNLGKFKISERDGGIVQIGKLTDNFSRITIFKFMVDDPEEINVDELMQTLFTVGTIMYHKDYYRSLRIIVDFTGFKYRFLAQITPMVHYKIYNIHEKVLKAHVCGIDLINAPPFVSKFLNVIKVTIKPKLFSRITVHENLESLHQNISPEFLPREYGGCLESTKDMIRITDKIIQDEDKLFEQISRLFTDAETDPTFGIQGTFKSLNLD